MFMCDQQGALKHQQKQIRLQVPFLLTHHIKIKTWTERVHRSAAGNQDLKQGNTFSHRFSSPEAHSGFTSLSANRTYTP